MGLFRLGFSLINIKENVCPQDFPYQDQIGKETQAKSSNSQLDPDENWQHDQVQLKEETLAQNEVEAVNVTFFIENNDVLKWIIDDQQIDELPILENSQLEETQAIHSIPISSKSETTEFILQEIVLPVKVEVKTEDLGEDEKYRKMRSQNNEASRKCRLNRKRKQEDMEEECKLLEERNVFLKSRLEEMEQEVKAWKKKLLTDIASTSQNRQL